MKFRLGRNFLFSAILLGILSLRAQSPQPAPSEMIRLRSVEATRVSSPRYAADIRGQSIDRDGRLDWLMLEAVYDTSPQWTDEITLTFYVVLKGKLENLPRGSKEVNLFSGTVTIVNVPQVRGGETTMFLDPYTLMRYGDPTHVAVVVTIDGKPAAVAVEPSSSFTPGTPPWWERETPNPTPLLTRDKTPYALIEIDKQNTIKP